MIVILENGKKYIFVNKEGKNHFMVSALKEGVVKEFHDLEVGKPLSLTFYPCNVYTMKVNTEDEMFFKSASSIAEIKN